VSLTQCNTRLATDEVDILLLGGSDVKGEETLMATEIVHHIIVSSEIDVLLSERDRRRGKIGMVGKRVRLTVLNIVVTDADVFL